MNILVTGANGQLGMELRLLAENSDLNFLFTDIVSPEPSGILDITDAEAVMRYVTDNHIEIIVNCAAYTNVERAEDEPDAAYAVNCAAAKSLAAAAKAAGATLIHISTDYVFSGVDHVPHSETDETEPLNVYGKTKLEGEKAIEESGCNYLIFRTSGLYSPFGSNFVKTIRRLLSERDEVKVVSDQVCTPTYAADLAALIVKIMEAGLYDHTGLYHFSNEGQCSWYEFALAIAELSDTYYNRCLAGENLDVKKDGNMRSICKINPCSSAGYGARAQRPAYSVLDKSKVKETFWFEIPAWRESLRACIDRMKINY